MALKDRIDEILAAGFSPSELARAAGKTPSAVTHWTSGATKTIKADAAAGIESVTGFSAVWIATGRGAKRMGNVEPGPTTRGKVPLISFVQAGEWVEAHDPYQPEDAEAWLPCLAPHSPDTFALRVRGDSMTARHGRSYPEGSVIFVDPMKKSPKNGDRIIAKMVGTNEVTFKVFKEEDGMRWLQPLNELHLPMRDEFAVIGTVIGKWEYE